MNLLVIVPAERKTIVPAIQGTNFLNMPGSLRPAVRSSIASMMSAIQAISGNPGACQKLQNHGDVGRHAKLV